jgi:hypothetical protein
MNIFSKMKKRWQWKNLPDDKKQQMMDRAVDLLNFDLDAYELFKMPQADGVKIYFSAGLLGSDTAAQYVQTASGQRIEICPFSQSGKLNTSTAVASSLAHELRHYWQHKKLGITPQNRFHINRNPRLAFIFNRVVEADAYAFQDKFMKTMTESLNIFSDFAKKIPYPTTEEAQKINQQATKKFLKLRAGEENYMRARFLARLENEELSNGYDPEKARHLHLWHTHSLAETTDFDAVKSVPELNLADIKNMLRTHVGKDAASYLGGMTDDSFEDLVLGHAHPDALEAVTLMEKFNKAVAANDNKTAKELRRRVKEKIYKLK